MPLKSVDYSSKKEGSFGTVADIIIFMVEKDIPLTAEMVYAGCGSHNIAFEWEDNSQPELQPSTAKTILPTVDDWPVRSAYERGE